MNTPMVDAWFGINLGKQKYKIAVIYKCEAHHSSNQLFSIDRGNAR